jgi:hypothetical protein
MKTYVVYKNRESNQWVTETSQDEKIEKMKSGSLINLLRNLQKHNPNLKKLIISIPDNGEELNG